MSNLDTIRAALLALVRAVPDIGQVHDRERYIREEAKFRELYLFRHSTGEEPQLRGWWLRRARTQENTIGISRNVEVHTWHLRGYLALADAASTELAFDGLIESLRDAFRADPTLGGVCEQSPLADGNNTDGLQLLESGPVLFCGVLCHSALLELRTWSYL
jgi:hypothetical protein